MIAPVRICGCDITCADADRLADSIDTNGAIEVAAAIRWASRSHITAATLQPDIREAVTNALTHAPVGALRSLSCLKDALDRDCC